VNNSLFIFSLPPLRGRLLLFSNGVIMAKTLWPYGTIVCYKEFDDIPYKLMTRVTEGHKKYIPVMDILTLEIEWVFLSDLEYLDKPEKYKEYYYAVRRENSKTIRRAKGATFIYRGRSSKKPSKGEQGSRDESPQSTS
tara:strand:- start:11 stop:424 length:414 start_codon:yes stop_codon:yes gene_type:complete